jgi:hypothetical protein
MLLTDDQRQLAKQLIKDFLQRNNAQYPEYVLQALPKIYHLLDENGLAKWDYGTFAQTVEQIFLANKQDDMMSGMFESLRQQRAQQKTVRTIVPNTDGIYDN